MKVTAILLVGIMLIAAAGVRGGINDNGKVVVHVLPYDCDRACNRKFPVIGSCRDLRVTHSGCGHIDFFPVFFDLVEYQGLEYAVEWPGTYSCVYICCSYIHLGEIVWSGDGTSQIWQECQNRSIGIPGWGWITVDVPGMVCVVPHPVAGAINVGDCQGSSTVDALNYPYASYCAGICGARGHDPCLPKFHATVPTTWGSIKGIFR